MAAKRYRLPLMEERPVPSNGEPLPQSDRWYVEAEDYDRLAKALQWFVDRADPIQSKFDLHGSEDAAKAMRAAYRAARAALNDGGSATGSTK